MLVDNQVDTGKPIVVSGMCSWVSLLGTGSGSGSGSYKIAISLLSLLVTKLHFYVEFSDLTYPQFLPLLRYIYTGQCEVKIPDIDLVDTVYSFRICRPVNLCAVIFYIAHSIYLSYVSYLSNCHVCLL